MLDSTNSHHQLGNKWICNGECEENEKEDGRKRERGCVVSVDVTREKSLETTELQKWEAVTWNQFLSATQREKDF